MKVRALTPDEKFLLSLCYSDAQVIKSTISLWLGRTEMKGPKQLVASGLYRERQLDLDGHLFTVCEEQVMMCGVGIFNWWATTLWVSCKQRKSSFSRVDRDLLEKVREERRVHAAGERPARKLRLEGQGLGVLSQGQ